MIGRALGVALVGLVLLATGAAMTRADESAAAFPVPPVASVAHPFWLVASDFTPGELVQITLMAPSGQTCAAVIGQCSILETLWLGGHIASRGSTARTSSALQPRAAPASIDGATVTVRSTMRRRGSL